uniref:Uncharacterized protein n=1 Tax=Ditylenchus dipsaci TaxID=166011 RepID=A0A915CQX2_9BILA
MSITINYCCFSRQFTFLYGSGSGSGNFHVGYKENITVIVVTRIKAMTTKKMMMMTTNDDTETEKFKAEGTFEEEHKSVRTHQRKTKKRFKKKKKSEKDGGGDNNEDDQPIVVPVEERICALLNPESLNQDNATITELIEENVEKKAWPFEETNKFNCS